jgi:putative DNA primase/helicase
VRVKEKARIIEGRFTFSDEDMAQSERDDGEWNEPLRPTDISNSRRFREMHGDKARYSTQSGWLIWDGRRWQRDDTREVERLARQVALSIYQEAVDAESKEMRQTLADWAKKSESAQKLSAMLQLARSELGIAVKPDIFDCDLWLLNLNNGTLNLMDGKLRPHARDDFITRATPIDYDPQATCPLWLRFLDRIFDGSVSLIQYVQKIAGYCLTGDTREQEFYISYGCGANGKTTFVKTLLHVLGEYAVQSPIETFMVKRNEGISNDLARLAGARLVAATESEANQRLAESLVKAVTGGDKITARFLHQEFFDFVPRFKLILSTNHKPRIVGTDHALWRRIRLVPFEVTIPKTEQDRELSAKLEAEAPGILKWCVDGCLLWQLEGLDPPAVVASASSDYRGDMDTLGEFLDTCCTLEEHATATAKDLYGSYVAWLEENKDQGLSKRAFGLALAERGFKPDRTSKERLWHGLRVGGSDK